MSVTSYVKEVTAIRAEYEARLERARAGYDACREALEIEHDRALQAERARDLLIEMSISCLPKTYPAEPYLLETAITGRESFATKEEAVARLLEVAGVTEDTNTEDRR